MDIIHLLVMALSFIGIFFMLLTYTYIDKIEKTGCACSESKYRSFVKYYSIFLVFYLFVTMVFPASTIHHLFGEVGSMAYMVLRPTISAATIMFVIIAIMYLRNLVNTKCQCSEDIRRELVYIYYIVEIVLISMAVLILLVESIIMGAVGMGLNSIKQLDNNTVLNTIANPVKAISHVPGNLKYIKNKLGKSRVQYKLK